MESRCDKVHAKVKRNKTEQSRLRINSKVASLYTRAMEVGYQDRDKMFSKSLEEKQQESVKQLERWVANTTPAIKMAAYDYTRRNLENTKDIRDYFGANSAPVRKNSPRQRRKTTHANKSQANTTSIADHPT